MDRAEEKLRSLLESERYRPAVLEKLAWVYEQQREWRAALDVWSELPPEKQLERAVVAAHYCCELGEAALAAGEFATARTQVAAARAHHAGSARASILAARIAAASGDEEKALELYSAALGASRTMLVAFEAEARKALQSRGGALTDYLLQHPPQDEVVPPEPPKFRCEECGVANTTWHWRCPSCRNWDSLRSTINRRL
jgi:lipopolysaccharide biosynthesis regulator YciM